MTAPVIAYTLRNNVDWRAGYQLAGASGPLGLGAVELHMTVRDAVTNATVLRLRTPGPDGRGTGITIVDPAQGLFLVAVPALTMLGINPGAYVHDLVAFVAGARIEIYAGTMTVVQGVTLD